MAKQILSELELSQIKEMYEQNLSVKRISERLNISEWVVRQRMMENGIKLRHRAALSKKYEIDDSFFEKIDSHEKAYWLGYLYADGCVGDYKKGYFFHLCLHNKDLSALENFQLSLKTNTPLHKVKGKNQSGLFVWSKKMCLDLIKLGCTPRKSLTLKFPTEDQVPKEFLPSMIHGYFDGDGCIQFSPKNYRVQIKIISSVDFCNGFINYIKQIGVEKFYIERQYSKNNIEYQTVGFGKFSTVNKFYELIYKNQTGLKRKKEIFEKANEWITNKK